MQTKTKMRYHLMPIKIIIKKRKQNKITVCEDGEKLGSLCVAGRNVKQYSYHRKL